jgi:signal transduction histidine kinase
LENALRYTVEGGLVQVDVKKGDGEVILEITNSFPPLEQEELESIFKPFYRGRAANREGTGLGLAIVQKIIGMHHGAVGARNVPEGFQVWVRLPATSSVKGTE